MAGSFFPEFRASSDLSEDARLFLAAHGFAKSDIPEVLDSRIIDIAEAGAALQKRLAACDFSHQGAERTIDATFSRMGGHH